MGPLGIIRRGGIRPAGRTHVATTFAAVAFVGVWGLLTPREMDAQQRISGIVIEDSTRRPIPDVALTVLDVYERPLSVPVRSDSSGRFALRIPKPGRYRILATRIGFARTITPTVLVEGGLEVPVELVLTRYVQLLAPLTITARPILISRDLEEFEHRKKMGFGTTYTREEIAERNPLTVTDLLRTVPGLRIFGQSGYDSLMFAANARPDYTCLPVFYLDGFKIGFRPARISQDGEEVPYETPLQILGSMMRMTDIYGIEIYRGLAQMPARFMDRDAGCGVIAVWTRRGG